MEVTPIRNQFDLQISQLRLERQQSRLDAALRQAKFDLREAKIAQAEYGSTLKSFLDKFTGKREEVESSLRHAVQKAEATLASAQQEHDALTNRLSELGEQLSLLPDWESRNDVDKQVNIIISNAEAQAAKLEAEGEAEYMRMLAEAYDTEEKQDFYKFTLALDALKQSLTGKEKTVILDGSSELARILMGTD